MGFKKKCRAQAKRRTYWTANVTEILTVPGLLFQGLIIKKVYVLTLGTQETTQKGSYYAAICQYKDAKQCIKFHLL